MRTISHKKRKEGTLKLGVVPEKQFAGRGALVILHWEHILVHPKPVGPSKDES